MVITSVQAPSILFFFYMESDGLRIKEERNVDGKIRKYYTTTEKGNKVLNEARNKAYELFKEIKD